MSKGKKSLTQLGAIKLVTDKLIKAFEEGFDASFFSLIDANNPYPIDCLEHSCWNEGKRQGIISLNNQDNEEV